jgi:hypothetical protein
MSICPRTAPLRPQRVYYDEKVGSERQARDTAAGAWGYMASSHR